MEIPESPISQQSDDGDTERQYDGTYVEIVIELGQEIANECCKPNRIDVTGEVVRRPQEQLILLLKEEMIGIPELEECPAGNSPKDDCRNSVISSNGGSHPRIRSNSSISSSVVAQLVTKRQMV